MNFISGFGLKRESQNKIKFGYTEGAVIIDTIFII
jgi:hypothetical protein